MTSYDQNRKYTRPHKIDPNRLCASFYHRCKQWQTHVSNTRVLLHLMSTTPNSRPLETGFLSQLRTQLSSIIFLPSRFSGCNGDANGIIVVAAEWSISWALFPYLFGTNPLMRHPSGSMQRRRAAISQKGTNQWPVIDLSVPGSRVSRNQLGIFCASLVRIRV